jgi:branched-chain amino acid transport system ATP-binding protein
VTTSDQGGPPERPADGRDAAGKEQDAGVKASSQEPTAGADAGAEAHAAPAAERTTAPEEQATDETPGSAGPEGRADRQEHEAGATHALLRTDSVVAGYVPGVNILNGCDFYVNDGELVGIIGPNGAGKSTLLKALFGLIPVRSGAVRLCGEDITGLPAHTLVERGVGYVPQTNNVFSRLTVEENLEMGLFLRPKLFRERFEVVTGIFPMLGDRRKQRAGSLSGGERQMVAMGRALMMDPSVLLLDEPSAGLSPAYQDEVFIRCRRINAAGVSIVMVEQNAQRCLQICDRGFVLDQGANAYTGTGDALLKDPKVIELYLGTLAKSA